MLKAPADLLPRGPGRALWRSILAEYEVDTTEDLELLSALCRTADELGRLEVELRSAPTLVPGSKGQERPNMLFAEVRAHRATMVKLLTTLGYEGTVASSGTAKSDAARKLALIRWNGPSRHAS